MILIAGSFIKLFSPSPYFLIFHLKLFLQWVLFYCCSMVKLFFVTSLCFNLPHIWKCVAHLGLSEQWWTLIRCSVPCVVLTCAWGPKVSPKMAAGHFWKATCSSFYIQRQPVNAISIIWVEELWDGTLRCVSEVCFISSQQKLDEQWWLDRTWQMTVTAGNSAEGHQSEATTLELSAGLYWSHWLHPDDWGVRN